MVDAPAAGHHALAVAEGLKERREAAGPLQHRLAMHGHAQGLRIGGVAARGDKP
jgi:hypothetical protein